MGDRTAAILLAAGESVRMGSPKPLLPWFGSTLINYQIEQLACAGLDQVIVVLGHAADAVAECLVDVPRVIVRVNHAYREGKSSSVRTGASAVRKDCDAILVLAVDQPRGADTLRYLVSAHQKGRSLITLPVCDGRRGHPPVFDSSLIPELLHLSEETRGLRQVLTDHQADICEVVCDNPEVLMNLNAPEDYRDALRYFGARFPSSAG